MPDLGTLRVQIFADGADVRELLALARRPDIAGFTTNPTLMRKAGVRDYKAFALTLLDAIPDRPVSFEVLADDFDEMERQAREIASWGANVYVKVPITDTRGVPSAPVVRRLVADGIRVNVTAILTLAQVREASDALGPDVPGIVSVFAGRVADTGCDPVPLMAAAAAIVGARPRQRLLWASPREVLNVFQADAVGCHVITLTAELLAKLTLVGRDLDEYSLATVRMFHEDARLTDLRI
jgi:transaldolase